MSYVRSEKESENIVQDCFLAIWEKRESLIFDEHLKSYLYTTVKNKSLNYLTKKKIFVDETQGHGLEVTGNMPSPVQKLTQKETEKIVFHAIDSLPPKCKRIFLLSRQEEMSYKEIAELLEINIKTVENQIANALKIIREKMGIAKGQSGSQYYLPSIFFLVF